MNGRENVKVNKTGGISCTAFPFDLENNELFKTLSEKVQHRIGKFVPIVSTSAENRRNDETIRKYEKEGYQVVNS